MVIQVAPSHARDVCQLPAAVGAEDVEEGAHGVFGAPGFGPQQPAGVVIDHDGEIAVVFAVGDLIDPDPPQFLEPVNARVGIGPDPGDDRAYRAPGDPHQLRDRGLRGLRGQPRHLSIEGIGMTGVMAGPRHMSDHHPVHRTLHPHRIGLHKDPDRS